jgi:hypothetical protein
MDLQVILGSFCHWQGRLWLRSLKNSPTNPTLHNAMDQITISGPLFTIFGSNGSLLNGVSGHSLVIWPLAGRIVAQKSENLTCFLFLPQVSATNQTPRDCHRPDDHLRTTVHHFLDPLGAGEMDLHVILWSLCPWQGGLWLRSLKNSTVFAPSLGHKSNTPQCHEPNDHFRTTVHHSLDPLGAGEMDLQVILWSFGHWQGGLWLRSLKISPVFCFCPKSWP